MFAQFDGEIALAYIFLFHKFHIFCQNWVLVSFSKGKSGCSELPLLWLSFTRRILLSGVIVQFKIVFALNLMVTQGIGHLGHRGLKHPWTWSEEGRTNKFLEPCCGYFKAAYIVAAPPSTCHRPSKYPPLPLHVSSFAAPPSTLSTYQVLVSVCREPFSSR